MKTFLETHREHSRTFLLYGNINDLICCGDLVIRSCEQFLVKYLRSRGYRHIIFYGDAATKGAYCRDPVSARFFFGDNQGIPMPNAPTEPETGAPRQPSQGPVVPGDQLADMVGRRRYRPGDQPGKAPHAPAKPNLDAAGNPEGPSSRVRYSYRAMTLESFTTLISPLMLEPENRIAVIFYNIFTTELGRVAALRDNILNVWEQVRGKSGSYNICLLLAPDTMHSTMALISRLNSLGLVSKFVCTSRAGDHSLNSANCFELGLPAEDEIRNLLRRFRIVGTECQGRKIRFQYRELEAIISEILYCSRCCDAREDFRQIPQTSEYMRQLAGRLQAYIEDQPGTFPVELTVETVDRIWDKPVRNREPALEQLKRPGWEAAYQVISQAVSAYGAYCHRQKGQKPERLPSDWAVRRFSTIPPAEAPRPPVPNFVLLGRPGVGKSTIARLIGKVLQEQGILKVGATVEVTQEALTSSYIAGTPKATMDCVNRAEEGVLFIDEAHSLGRRDGGTNNEGTGVGVVSTLNAAMTDPNRHFSVVLAGYEEEMKAVFALDDGFARRFGPENFIVIDDYKPELLERILLDAIVQNKCRVDLELTEERLFEGGPARPLACYINRVYQNRDRRRFGNAGAMEKLALTVCGKAEDGVVREACFYTDEVDHQWFVPADGGSSVDRIVAEIRENFVGMDWAERYFQEKAHEIEEVLANGGSEEDTHLRPLILVGEPGTGKTSFAEHLARLYCHLHLLGSPDPIIITGSSLASSLAGGAQEKVLRYIRDAQDKKGLLFVDEAHQLATDRFDGAGALKAFLNPLTDRAHPFLTIFAVYPSMLDEFLKLDPGMESRFEIIRMPSYTGPQLFAILQMMMGKSKPPLSMSEETGSLLERVCCCIYDSRTEHTGNARRMERLLEEMNALRRKRCKAQNISVKDPACSVFLPEDIPEELLAALPPEEPDPEQLMVELNSLCGLEAVKEDVRKLINQARVNKLRKEKGLPVPKASLHMVFQGNPGTGKTTVARLIGKLYRSIGVLPRGQLVEKSRADLVAGYIGQTELKTQAAIEEAMGGILFIDEAYALCEGGENDFGQRAIDTLLKAMEDHYGDLMVIVAGYPDKMERFIQSNPGLKDRFQKYFLFADYSLEQLVEILFRLCTASGYELAEGTGALARRVIERELFSCKGNFGNGRFVRNLFGQLTTNQANRIAQMGLPDVNDLSLITEADFAGLV